MCPKPTGGRARYRQYSSCAAGIIALLCFVVMLGGARPAITAPPTGMIEGVAKDTQGQPLPAYIDTHGIQTDHSQRRQSRGRADNDLPEGTLLTRFSVDLLAGTGTRTTRPGGPPNGGTLPSYSQTNLGVSHTFELPHVGAIKVRFDVINLFDEIYLLRSSTSIGAFSPAFAPRRTFYAGITKQF